MFYLGQRSDCDSFSLAADIDPAYTEAFAAAHVSGIEAICYGCALSTDEIRLAHQIPIDTDC